MRSADEYFSKLSAGARYPGTIASAVQPLLLLRPRLHASHPSYTTAHSEPNLLDIGVEPDQYNEADREWHPANVEPCATRLRGTPAPSHRLIVSPPPRLPARAPKPFPPAVDDDDEADE